MAGTNGIFESFLRVFSCCEQQSSSSSYMEEPNLITKPVKQRGVQPVTAPRQKIPYGEEAARLSARRGHGPPRLSGSGADGSSRSDPLSARRSSVTSGEGGSPMAGGQPLSASSLDVGGHQTILSARRASIESGTPLSRRASIEGVTPTSASGRRLSVNVGIVMPGVTRSYAQEFEERVKAAHTSSHEVAAERRRSSVIQSLAEAAREGRAENHIITRKSNNGCQERMTKASEDHPHTCDCPRCKVRTRSPVVFLMRS